MAGIAPPTVHESTVEAHVAEADPHTQYQLKSEKGNANGYASLNGSGVVPDDELPDISISNGASFPGFSTPVTVPLTTKGRHVTAIANLTATGSNGASIDIEVETGLGAGTYAARSSFVMEAVAASRSGTLSAWVPPGYRYQFVNGALAGVTEVVASYSYTDL